MYPHPVDRYRIAAILLDHEIKKKGLSAQEVAKGAKIADTIIYNLKKTKYLEGRALARQDVTKRYSLLNILGWGFKYRPEDIDLFLWLYRENDFHPLNEDEKHRYVTPKNKRFPGCSDVETLRKRVLVLLKEALNKGIAISKDSPPIKVILDLAEEEQLEAGRALLEFETLPGQRLVVMKYPSFLTYTPELLNLYIDKLIYPQIKSEEGKTEARRIRVERWGTFLDHLELYGERCIYPKLGVETYLSEIIPHYRLSLEERRAHIRNMIALLVKYDHYQVALPDSRLGLEMGLKTVAAMMRGAPSGKPWNKERIVCGPRYIYWRDKTSILSFLLDFEREWDVIPKENRDKEYVIPQLERMLDGK
jgi:hypothetical protein